MDPIVSAPFVVLLTTLLDGMSLYGVCCVSLGEKPTWKDGLLFVGIIFLLERGRSSLPGGWLFRFCLSDVFCAYVIAGSFCLPPAWAVPLDCHRYQPACAVRLRTCGWARLLMDIWCGACQCHDRQLRLGACNTEPCQPGDSLPLCRASLPSTPPVAAASCQIVSLSVSLQGFSFIGRGFCLRLYAFQSAHAAG